MADPIDLRQCIDDVCAASVAAQATINQAAIDATDAANALTCVTTADETTDCTLPDATQIPSVQKQLASLTGDSISDINASI